MKIFSRKPNNLIKAAGIALIVIIIASMAIGVAKAASPDITRKNTVEESPSLYGLDYTDISFPTSDGLTLRGWWLGTDDTSPTIIFLHAVGGNRSVPADRVFGIASHLVQRGYNVLMFDLRAHGESDGSSISAGVRESGDVLSAIDYLRSIGVSGKIGVLGFSMGAATALLATAETDQISCVIADSSYSDVSSVIVSQCEKRDIPEYLASVFMSAAKTVYGVNFNTISPLNALKTITVPVFIIHGQDDQIVPVDEAVKLETALRNPASEFWVVPDAPHTGAYSTDPKDYIDNLLGFLDAAFSSSGRPASEMVSNTAEVKGNS